MAPLIIIGILLTVSFVMALFSLKKELTKPKEVEEAKADLSREKILYSRS